MTSFGESNHHFKQTLMDYSKKFNQLSLKNYKIVYDEGNVYHNLDISQYIIHSHNFIEGHIILADLLNVKLKRQKPTDVYQLLWEYCSQDSDDSECNFNENNEPLFPETALNGNEIWLEEIYELNKNLIILTIDPIQVNDTLIDVQFSINISLLCGSTSISNITKKHIDAITSNIKKNAQINDSEKIISRFLGFIELNECNIKIKNNVMNVTMSVKTEKKCSATNNEIKDIIWSIFPSINNTQQFKFIIDSTRTSNYTLQFLDELKIHSIEISVSDIIFE